MFIFLVLFLPLVFVWFSLHAKDKVFFASGLWGIFAAVLDIIFLIFFTNQHHVFLADFFSNFVYFSVNEYFLPVFVWSLFYFLILKESNSFKLSSLFIFQIGFFAVFLPYFVLSSETITFSFFELFLKPVLVLSMILIFKFLVDFSIKFFESQKKFLSILLGFLAFVNYFIPSVLESLWILKSQIVLLMILIILYCAFGLFIFIFEKSNFNLKNLVEE